MLTYQSMYEHELKKIIDEMIEVLKENMAGGLLSGYDDYKYNSGKIAGLREAINAMEEADRICSYKAR